MKFRKVTMPKIEITFDWEELNSLSRKIEELLAESFKSGGQLKYGLLYDFIKEVNKNL